MNTPTIAKPHRRRLQAHFGLSRLPFRKNMAASDMFDSRSQRELSAGLEMWLEVRGIAMVTGHSGVGKSITMRRFLWALDKDRFNVLKLTYLPTTPVGLLRSMCRLLGLPLRPYGADLFDAVQQYLSAYQKDHGPHPLLVIDDAEGLRAPALDMLRRLTTYDLDAEDRFSLLLAGTEKLLSVLSHPELVPLRSRIVYPQPLRPFSLEDTRNYIRFHLDRAEADPNLLSDPATQRVFQLSQGRPRDINLLCLFLLIQAAVAGRNKIDGDFAQNQLASHPLYKRSRQE